MHFAMCCTVQRLGYVSCELQVGDVLAATSEMAAATSAECTMGDTEDILADAKHSGLMALTVTGVGLSCGWLQASLQRQQPAWLWSV